MVDHHDVFAYSYKDLNGIPREICEHKIELVANAQPIKQIQCKMNPNYALKMREDLDKLLNVGFIYPVETTLWLSPFVIVPKKNAKLKICVDYCKLNAQTKKDPFPLPFLEYSIMDSIARHEMYSFMDGYSDYNQVKMVEEGKDKITFISKWGTYAFKVMPFGLRNAHATFQKVVTKIFKPYLNKFMQVFLDDFNVYGDKKDHLEQLQKFLEECRLNGISLNPKKCVFCVNSGILFGHIVCHDGMLVDPRKITTIIAMPTPINPIEIK